MKTEISLQSFTKSQAEMKLKMMMSLRGNPRISQTVTSIEKKRRKRISKMSSLLPVHRIKSKKNRRKKV